MVKQVSIRFEPDNYDWLKEQLREIKPATTLNKLVNFIVQQAREEKEQKDSSIFTVGVSGNFIEIGKAVNE